jgi:hypothetical protein
MNKILKPYGKCLWNNNNDLMNSYSSGLPFLVSRQENNWKGLEYNEEGEFVIDCGFRASYLCFLGNISTYDKGTGSWFSPRGDMSKEQFIGDVLGEMEIILDNNEKISIPLIFGFTLWWDEPLRPRIGHGPYHEPFKSDENAKKTLDEILYLNRYKQIYENETYEPGMAYCSIIDIKGGNVKSVKITKDKKYFGEPLFIGMTVLSEEEIDNLYQFPKPHEKVDLSDKKIITSDLLSENFYKQRVKDLMKVLYTFKEDCIEDFEIEIPDNYSGPVIKFGASRYGKMLTNMYYANMQDLLDKTDNRNHMTPTSTRNAPAWGEYPDSVGTWRINVGRGNNDFYAGVWSRDGGRAGIERRKFGYISLTPNEVNSFDKCLYTTMPPHWPRDINNILNMHSNYDAKTIDGKRIVGVPENDGHGIVMAMRYTDWFYSQDREKWYNDHWKATEDSAEWICWLLDHKLTLEQPDDILWSVTEPSGHGGVEIYSNIMCLYGLISCINIANYHNNVESSNRWDKYAQRLRNGIKLNLIQENNGEKIWLTHPRCSWQDHDEGLAPIFAASELFGFLLTDSSWEKDWYENALSTYTNQIMSEPRFNHARAFGYGYGYLVQAALLLDMMNDTDILTKNICDHSYFSKLQKWIVPEGVAVHPSGEYWYRSGDHGNTAQQVEILKMIRIFVGIDDMEEGILKIIPRIPDCVDNIDVSEFTVRNNDGKPVKVEYKLSRDAGGIRFVGNFGNYTGRLVIRLEQIDQNQNINIVSSIKPEIISENSGDRNWVRFEFNSTENDIKIELGAMK